MRILNNIPKGDWVQLRGLAIFIYVCLSPELAPAIWTASRLMFVVFVLMPEALTRWQRGIRGNVYPWPLYIAALERIRRIYCMKQQECSIMENDNVLLLESLASVLPRQTFSSIL
jgi:hypothetical protein